MNGARHKKEKTASPRAATPMLQQRDSAGEQGFTLIEVMVALGLFALIALAGVTLVESVMNVDQQTSSRLERLTDLRRAMQIVSLDLDQIAPGDLAGGADRLSLSSQEPSGTGLTVPYLYRLEQQSLVRQVNDGPPQNILAGVAAMRWRFYTAGSGWVDRWPAPGTPVDSWPRAVALELTLARSSRPGGTVRRVVLLPERP